MASSWVGMMIVRKRGWKPPGAEFRTRPVRELA
jgi:hypothetical protein